MFQRVIACLIFATLTATSAFPQAETMGDTRFASASEAYKGGDIKKAIEIFESILRDCPTYSGTWGVNFNLAVAYYQVDRYEDAIVTFQKIIDKCPDPQMKEQAALLVAGAQAAKVANAIKPEDGPAERGKAFAPCIAAYEAFLSKYPESKSKAEALYGKATAQYQADDLGGSEKTLGDFSKLQDKSTFEVEAGYLLARVYASQGKKILDDKKNPNAKAEAQKRFDEAEKLFSEISKNQKSLALANDAMRSAGEILIKAEEYQRALKYLRQVLPTAKLIEQQQDFINKINSAYKQAIAGGKTAAANEYEKQRDREVRRIEALRTKVSTFLAAQLFVIQCNLNLKRYEEGLLLAKYYFPFFDPDQKKLCNFFIIMGLVNKKDVEATVAKYNEFKTSYPKDKMTEGVPGAIAGLYADLGKHGDAVKWAEEYLTDYPKGQYEEQILFMRAGSGLAWANGETDPTKKSELLAKADAANKEFRDKYPKSALAGAALFQKAYGSYQKGDYAGAIPDLREYIAKFPDVDNTHTAAFLIIQCLSKLNKNKELIDECVAFEKKFPKSEWCAIATYQMGKTYEAARKPADAIKVYEHIVKDYAKSEYAADAQYDIATCYFRLGKRAEAIKELKRFIEIYPDHKYTPTCYLIIADELKNDGKYDDSVKAYQDIIAKYPDSETGAESMLNIGAMYAERASKMAANPQKLAAEKQAQWKDLMEKAKQAYEEIVKKYAKFSTVDKALSSINSYWQMQIHATFGTKEQAVQYFQKLAGEGADAGLQIKIHFTLGSLLSQLDDREAALKALTDAWEKAKSSNTSLPNSGYEEYRGTLCDAGKFDEAIAVSDRQLEEKKQGGDQKGVAEATLGLGRAWFEKGDSEKAAGYLKQVLNDFSWYQDAVPEAMRYLAWIEEKKKNYKEAIKQYELILPKLPLTKAEMRIKVWMREGYTYYAMANAVNDPKEKAQYLTQAIGFFLKIGVGFKVYKRYCPEGLFMGAQIAETGIAILETDPKTKLPTKFFTKVDAVKYYNDIVSGFPNSVPWAEKAKERLKAIGPVSAPPPGAAPKKK